MRLLKPTLSIAVLLTASAAADPDPRTHYAISATLTDDGRLIGEPRLTMLANQAARIEVGDANRSYSINVTARPAANGDVLTEWKLSVADDMAAWADDRNHRPIETSMLVKPGKRAGFASAAQGASKHVVQVNFTIDQVTS